MQKVVKTETSAILIVSIGFFSLTLLPFFLSTPYYDSQRLISVIIISAIAILFTRNKKTWSKKTSLLFLSLIITGIASTNNSLLKIWPLLELLLLISVFLAILNIFKNINFRQIHYISILFIFAQLVYTSRFLTNYLIIILNQETLDFNIIIDGFTNRRFYGHFLSWTVPFLLGYLAISKKNIFKKLIILTIILSWSFILISGTRAFLLGIIISNLCIAWIMPKLLKKYLFWTILTGLFGTLVYINLVFVIPYLFNLDNSLLTKSSIQRDLTSSSGRVEIWKNSIDIIVSNPLLGTGPMTTAVEGVLNKVSHPHNSILQIMAEWGIPFAIILVFSATYLLIKVKKLIIKGKCFGRTKLALPITASICSAGSVSLVSGIIVMPISLAYMTIILGTAAGLWRSLTPHVIRKAPPDWLAAAIISIPIFLLILTIIQWIDITSINQNLEYYSPRFWLNGTLKL